MFTEHFLWLCMGDEKIATPDMTLLPFSALTWEVYTLEKTNNFTNRTWN